MPYTPNRGDVVWLTFDPQKGHEQSGRHPALVLSPKTYNLRVGLAICCPITSQIKGYPFEVNIPEGTPLEGVILSDQIKSLDWKARQADKIASLEESTVQDVLQKLSTLLYAESDKSGLRKSGSA